MEKRSVTHSLRNHGRLIIAILVIGIMIALRYSRLADYVTLDFFAQNKEFLQTFIEHHYFVAVLICIGLYALAGVLAIPAYIVFTVSAGYFFGSIPAVIYSNIGSTLGALIAFCIFRYLLYGGLHKKYGAKLEVFSKKFKQHGASYLLFLQLLPITPFSIINVVAAMSDVSLLTFYWTTAVGIIPGSLIYAFAGSQLATMTTVSDILSPSMIIALTLLACMALLPIIAQRLKFTGIRD